MSLRLTQIHRYPIKSMGGERLECVQVDDRGLEGDRRWAVYDSEGKLASGKHTRRFRRMDPVFELTARMTSGAAAPSFALPSGRWVAADDSGADAAVTGHFGQPVRLRRESTVAHHDDLPVSLVGTATLAALADLLGDREPVDVRHFRANLVIETEEPWVEETWVGKEVTVGEAGFEVVKPVERCRMVDIAQVGVPAHGSILRTVGKHRDLQLAVYAAVRRPGTVGVGDDLLVSP